MRNLNGPCQLPAAVLVFFIATLTSQPATAAEDFGQVVGPFIQKHCIACHNADKQEGDFRLDTLSYDVGSKDTSLWAEVRERISAGEMPPEDVKSRPTAAQGAAVVEWLTAAITAGEAKRMAQRSRVSFHRLSRDEYVNSIYDLLGVHYDAADPGGLSEDPNWHGFQRIGSVLSLSPAHIEKYFQAAETVLDEAYPDKPIEPLDLLKPAVPPNTVREPYRTTLEEEGLLDKVRFDLWPQDKHRYANPGRLTAPGVYEVSIQLSGLKPAAGRAPRLKVYHSKLDRVLFQQDVVAPEGKPVVVTFRTHLPAGSQQILLVNDVPGPSNLPRSGRHGNVPFVSIKRGRIPWQLKLTDEEGNALYPFLILDWAKWKGPLVSPREQQLRDDYMPEDTDDDTQVREGLSRMATRAFRRPLVEGEIEKYMHIVQSERAAGADSRSAVKTAMLAILCSKSFLFVVEGNEKEDRQTLSDWELATRLSYFLWSSMPDGELFQLAAKGELRQKDVLRKQVARMLAGPAAARFKNSFPAQWLRLEKVGMFPPDAKLYPEYDTHLEESMKGEPPAFFTEVLDKNLSIAEFLDSDWTMVNPRLASFYGIEGVSADTFQKVKLTPEHHRGGLLTQAAVLSLTSDGTRHRPVHRGVWLSESIFGKSPPPPPANVDPIEPNPPTQPKATIRMKLAAHQQHAQCAACHRKIDPLGFAFENYNAIGKYRTHERVANGSGADPAVDASGELPGGKSFAGAREFKQLLAADIDAFNHTLTKMLATYALRRVMTFEDEEELQAIANAGKADGYRLRDIVENLVLSGLFQQR